MARELNLGNDFDMTFSLTIDLSDYDDDEYVTIWIGRENGEGKPVAIFKFAEILIGIFIVFSVFLGYLGVFCVVKFWICVFLFWGACFSSKK